MGQNIILNAADHGFNVIAFNRTTSKVDRFLENEAKGMTISPLLFWQMMRIKTLTTLALQANPSRVHTQLKSSAPS